jgi:guanylate kinase
MNGQGRLVIISGPSGAGKSTVVDRLLKECDLPLVLSVSATTRQPRAGERDGVHYFFLSPEEFARRREHDDFLECCEVFGVGYWYGTLKSQVTTGLNAGKWIILEIDVAGAEQVLRHFPEAITIFVNASDLNELEQRLRHRASESEAALQRRLQVARAEIERSASYRHRVVNHDVEQTVAEICHLLHQYC